MVLLDVLLGVFTVTLIAAGIFSLTPTIRRSHEMADEESRAVLMANRMLEHLQLLTPDTLNEETLDKLNLIDSYDDDDEIYSFSRVPLDEGARYSPATSLPQGQGSFTLTEITGGSVRVDLKIRWRSAAGKSRIIRTGTIIGGYK